MIVPHSEIRESVFRLHKSGGLPRGSLTGWPLVDKYYTVGMGQWTLVTGVPHAGKSEWVDALLVNLAKREDWRFYIFSPENWPLAIHHAKILEKYIGKPFNPGPTLRMDVDDVEAGEAWMEGKFFFCKPQVPTLMSILGDAALEEPFHKEPQRPWKLGVVIDPWNMIEHSRPNNLSETEYVSRELSFVIEWVRTWNAHLWIIAHPAKMQRDRDGKYPIPTPRDVSGSAHFWNKADNCITVHRDQIEDSQDVDIHVQKVRFKHIGHIGLATLRYDRPTGRYFEPAPRIVQSYVTKDDDREIVQL